MAQTRPQENRGGRYIVIARVETHYEDCSVIPEDNVFPATHFRAFGPDTRKKCEDWMAENCDASKE